MGIKNYTLNITYPINAEGCPTWNSTTTSMTNQLSWLEMFFDCSGWCHNGSYYVFSNINFGVPQSNCSSSVSNFASTFGRIIMITSFSVSLFIMTILFVICCLWLHPARGLKYDSL
jgi:hypothetical protein